MPSQPCHDRKWPFNVPQIASPFDAKGAVISCKRRAVLTQITFRRKASDEKT